MKTKLNIKLSGNFTTVMNFAMYDPRLSFKALGLYCQMLSYPNEWEFSIRYLAKTHKDSRDSVATALNELLKYGYVTKSKIQSRNSDGSFGCYEYTVYQDARENPDYIPYTKEDQNEAKAKTIGIKTPCTENPCTEKPCTENPLYGKSVHGKTVYGKPVHGKTVYGKPVHGKTVYGKPVTNK